MSRLFFTSKIDPRKLSMLPHTIARQHPGRREAIHGRAGRPTNGVRISLHLNEGSDGILALRAARRLMEDGHRSCVYAYENGASIYVYATQTGVTAREPRNGPKDAPPTSPAAGR